ncbi:MAG: hypothetical protein WCG27_03810, partial [Pseudomonadota bacterium]
LYSASYTPAVEKIQAFIEDVAKNSYAFQKKNVGDTVRDIFISYPEKKLLISGTDYTVKGSTVIFREGLLVPGSKFKVLIKKKLD